MADDLLLEGLKVLDVSSWIAAPACATMLGDRGADVIKIEIPEVGDAYRNYWQIPAGPNSPVNYTWTLDNHNKRSICLDLKSPQGQKILHQLIADCDVYVTNQPMDFRAQHSLLWEDLHPLNERMIYASLTAYGEQGAESGREGFDLVGYWSRSGLMNQMRHKNTQPIQAMAGMGDHPTAVALYGSVMTALFKRERTGQGAKVHTSLLANGLWSASCWAQAAYADSDFTRIPPQRITTALYLAADRRWIQFSMIRKEDQFDQLILALGQPDWLVDERFLTPELRMENYQALTSMLRDVIKEQPSDYWMQHLTAQGVPVALVAQFEDLPADPQVLANDMARLPAEELGLTRVIRDPINVDGVGRVDATKAPDMGEHTDEILRELGYSDPDIESMRQTGVV